MESVLYFDKYEMSSYRGKLARLSAKLPTIESNCAVAVNQLGSSCKKFITNIYGKPVLQFGIYGNQISLWNYKTGGAIGAFDDIPNLDKIIDNVDKNLNCCNKCQNWFAETLKTDGFVGQICEKCWDSKIL